MVSNVVSTLGAVLRRQSFRPNWLGIVLNPFYIVRRGLYRNVSRLGPLVGGEVLDLGCGSKPYESLLPNASAYIGIDIAQSGHDHQRSRVDVFYDGKTIPFETGRFDAVVSFEVFEHIFNLDDVLTEIRRVTKLGGYLLVSIPFAWPEHEQPYDFGRYTSFGVKSVLDRHGYDVVELVKSGHTVSAISQLWLGYVFLTFSPKKNLILRAIFQFLVIMPQMLIALLISAALPKRDDLFCNLVILAQKRGDDGAL